MTASASDEMMTLCRRLGVPESAFAATGLPARSPITGDAAADALSLSGLLR